MHLTLSTLPSPIGPLAVACDADGRVRGVSFGEEAGAAPVADCWAMTDARVKAIGEPT